MSNPLNNFLNNASKALDIVPELYGDLAQPSTKEIGKSISIIPQLINTLLLPLRKWILVQEYNYKETETLLAKKLEKVKAENIVSPEPYVAVPALQALSYSMDSEDLRELYSNLLSKAMYTPTKDKVHPSFVQIIIEMSPLDANILKTIINTDNVPVADIQLKDLINESHAILFENLTTLSTADPKDVAISLSNLQRMQLIDIRSDISYHDESLYDGLLNHPISLKYKSSLDLSNKNIELEKKVIKLSPFGIAFSDICIKPIQLPL